MDLQADISWIRAEMKKVSDPDLIEVFKNLLKYRNKKDKSDWWNEISEADRVAIEDGMKDLEAGRVKPLEEVLAKYL